MGPLGEIFFSGLFLGSLYAMIGVGLALVWTTVGVFNFTHGVFITLGAYIAWQFAAAEALGLPFFLALPLALLLVALLGWLLQAAVVRPLVGRGDLVLVVVITTLAAGSFLENGTLVLWGPRPKQLAPLFGGTVDLFGLSVSAHQLAIVLITPFVLLGLWLLLYRTRLGLALRAVSQNEDAGRLVGLDVAALYGLSFALSAALAALAGIFLGGVRFMSPGMGTEPLVKALVVVIFGGIGNLMGPILAAYLIGFFEAGSSYLFGFYWTPALLFLVLIATLMIRPEGLFARRSRGLA